MFSEREYKQVSQTTDGLYRDDGTLDVAEIANVPHRRRCSICHVLSLAALSVLSVFLGVVIGLALAHPLVDWRNATKNQIGNDLNRPIAGAVMEIDGVEVQGTQCGKDWHEAKALGCHYDFMASRWYAPDCFDGEALEQMVEEQPYINFTWYTDKAHTEVYPTELVLRGEYDKLYPSGLYHLYHCLYLWRRLHRAVLHNRPIDEDLLSYGHTLHCTRMLLEYMDPDVPRNHIPASNPGTPFCRSGRLGVGTEGWGM